MTPIGVVSSVRSRALLLGVALALAAPAVAFALDSNKTNPPGKIPLRQFTSPIEALQDGLNDLQAGDTEASLEALTYAADAGEWLATWKLGKMYARGEGVQRDDAKAFHYFDVLVRGYDEDKADARSRGAVANAFVAVGLYLLQGIPGTDVKADPERAFELFQYAATTFRYPEAEYHLGRLYLEGTAGAGRDPMRAARWFALAADRQHCGAEAMLGHLLFGGDGVPRQRARGLMWLALANKGAQPGPKDDWIRELYGRDYNAASDDDREMAATYLADGHYEVDLPVVATKRAQVAPANLPPVAPRAAQASGTPVATTMPAVAATPASDAESALPEPH